MANEIEKGKKCAIKVLEQLKEHYEIDETEPIQASTTPMSEVSFSFIFNPHNLNFELVNQQQRNDPKVKELLDVLNRHLKKCMEK